MQSNHRYICVYGASSDDIPKVYLNSAYKLGEMLATDGWNCINGAGTAGIMRAVSDAFLDKGRKAMGIIPQFMVDNGWHYTRMSEIIVTPDMHTRKQTMAAKCHCAIAMPGGCGTLEELFEIITWRQLGLFSKPLIILNINGFYNDILSMLHKCINQGFMKASHANLWYEATSVEDAVEYIRNYNENSNITIETKY